MEDRELHLADSLHGYMGYGRQVFVAVNVIQKERFWFTLANAKDEKLVKEGRVELPDDADVDAFRNAVKALLADSLLVGIAPSDLRVFTRNAAFESVESQQPIDHAHEPLMDDRELHLEDQLNDLGTNRANALLVVAPKLSIEAILDFSGRLEIPNEECVLLDALEDHLNAVISTPGLNSFWDGYGGFPSFYFVRHDQAMFWQTFKQQFENNDGNRRLVVVDPPGVGRSCFFMLLGLYMTVTRQGRS